MLFLLFVACSNDNEYEKASGSQYAISFSCTLSEDSEVNKPSTRANTSQSLCEMGVTDFAVYGIKGMTSSAGTFTKQEGVVYSNSKVVWASNSANTTNTNSSGWEYVGIEGNDQTVKYWDYGQDTYYFWAIAKAENGKYVPQGSGTSAPQAVDGYATFDDQGRVATYTKHVSTSVNLSDADAFYYSDICKIEKTDFGKTVNLQFIPYLSRVRVAFYETIPGCVISDFVLTSAEVECVQSGTVVLAYDYTNSRISSSINSPVTNPQQLPLGSIQYMPLTKTSDDIDLTEGCLPTLENTEKTYLGRTSNTASFMLGNGAAKGYFINLMPYCNRNKDLTITCNYTETNTKTGAKNSVEDAKATVPMSYLNWKPGFAYTYIFKISESTSEMSLVEVSEVAIRQWDVEATTDHPVYNW